MRNLSTFFLISAVVCSSNSLAQYPDWINYTSGQSVYALTDNGHELWIGLSQEGIVKFDKITEEITCYNHANSGLPDNDVSALATDGDDIWIGTRSGLAKFDGSQWTTYNTNNSDLPDNRISSLTIDGNNIWIGTYGGGLAEFDGTNWTIYKRENSGLPDNWVSAAAVDGSGNLWAGTWMGGLAAYREGGPIIDRPVQMRRPTARRGRP